MPAHNVCLIGERGTVSQALQSQIRRRTDCELVVISTAQAQQPDFVLPGCDLVLLATTDFASESVVRTLPDTVRILDISPAFRLSPAWVYGLAELPGFRCRIKEAQKVANPGCFATSAILLLEPLIRSGLLTSESQLYLDATGGFTTGGARMVDAAEREQLAQSGVYSLAREHRHVQEIRAYAGTTGPLWFSPKVGSFPRGIRMQIPLFGAERRAVLDAYLAAYVNTEIQVCDEVPAKIAADIWAERRGAGIWVIPQDAGVLVTCALDNLGKGAIDSAIDNLDTMLSAHARKP